MIGGLINRDTGIETRGTRGQQNLPPVSCLQTITKRVNGGLNAYDERNTKYWEYLKMFGG